MKFQFSSRICQKSFASNALIFFAAISAISLSSAWADEPVKYEYKEAIATAKWNTCETSRDGARKWALTALDNRATDACFDLGDGWRKSKIVQTGYEQALPCPNNGGWKYVIDASRVQCMKRIQKVAPPPPEPTKAKQETPGLGTNNINNNLKKPPERNAAPNQPSANPLDAPNSETKRQENLLDGNAKSSAQRTSSVGNALDEVAERPQVQRKLNQEVAKYKEAAVAACNNDLMKIEFCYTRQGCTPPPLPSGITASQCDAIPKKPEVRIRLCINCTYTTSAIDREGDERKIREWESQYGYLHGVCKPYFESSSIIQSCRKNEESTCNPEKMNADSCLSSRMKNAPTYGDAKALMQEEWSKKASQPAARKNYLD